MRIGLRTKILLVTVLTPLVLAIATLATMQRDVDEHVDASSIHESLAHSEQVFESILATRLRAMSGGAQVIVQDPRFFSLLMLEGAQRDYRFQATLRGMAHDFNRIMDTDLFEVLDRHGRVLASVGASRSTKLARDSLLQHALTGKEVEGVLVQSDGHYQVALAPARADGRVVGVLLLGARMGNGLARQLRSEMRCQVTFISGDRITGTTLADPKDREALLSALATLDPSPEADLRKLGVMRIQGAAGTELTIVRRVPGARGQSRQWYVLQRSFDPETLFQRRIRQDLLLLAVVALAAAILSGWMFSNQILRPIQSLVQAAHAMETGNYDHPVGISRRDEVGYLATRFVEMRRRERGYVESLERAARMKSDFLRVASQELRSPISGLIGYRDLLAEGQFGAVTEPQRKALEAMRELLVRLTRVADEATRTGQIQGERLDLDRREHEIESILRLAVGQAHASNVRKDVSVEIRTHDGATGVQVDGDLVPKALAQLIEHTMRDATADSRVVIEAAVEARQLKVTIREGEPPVDETAGGADPDSLGLGISVARGILEVHGGTLRVISQPGRSNGFVAILPLDGEARKVA